VDVELDRLFIVILDRITSIGLGEERLVAP